MDPVKKFLDWLNHQIENPQFRVESKITRVTFKASDGTESNKQLLGENPMRVGFVVYNESSSIIRLAFDNKAATAKMYSTAIGANTEYPYLPDNNPYLGYVTYNPATAADGALQVTELFKLKNRKRGEL